VRVFVKLFINEMYLSINLVINSHLVVLYQRRKYFHLIIIFYHFLL